MKIYITTDKGTVLASPYIRSTRWSGAVRQCTRKLEIDLINSPTDPSIPTLECPNGSLVELRQGKETLFWGYALNRRLSTDSQITTITCFDRGRQLKGIRDLKTFTNMTPEEITNQLCGEYQIPIGSLAKTGISLSRLFLTGRDSIYDMIVTVYTLASRQNGKKYHIGFRGPNLYVTEIKASERTLVLEGKVNLIAAQVNETAENVLTEVAIYDQNNHLVNLITESGRETQFGKTREILKQTKENNQQAVAKTLLKDRSQKTRINIDNRGNIANVAGETVVVKEPHTGLHGLFYIQRDLHEWKKGEYFNRLEVNFEAIMDEKEVGTLPNAAGNLTKSR